MDPKYAPARFQLGVNYVAKGMYSEGIAEYLEMIRLGQDGPTEQVYLAAAYARAGKRKQALEILERLQASKVYVSPTDLAILYVTLGEREKAFASLEKAYDDHDLQLQFLGVEYSFDSLREDPRFEDLMRRVGLPVANASKS